MRHRANGRRRRTPRVHWFVLTTAAVLVFVLLGLYGVTNRASGENGASYPGGRLAAPERVLRGGPVLDAAHRHRPGLTLARKTIALTFDDGPSQYTPQVLDVLERYHVPATFFMIGSQIPGHAAVLRRMVEDGDEIGVHTFTHPELGAVSPWREHAELSATQLAISSATGYVTDLLRLPYSSRVSAMTADEWRAIGRAGNYRVVFTNLDTRDWARPGTSTIVARATPRNGAGAVVMMHDGGGDRSQTVRALAELIPRLKTQGYRFDTVSHAVSVPSPWSRASTSQRWRGSILLAALVVSRWLVTALEALFLITGALALLRTLVLVIFARRHSRSVLRAPVAAFTPPVTVVVPAYNERVGIERCVRSLASNDYPEFEVIVVDDGSTDGTAALVRALELPRVRVVAQRNAGKPAALRTGVRAARHDVLVLVDGDTVFDPDSIRELVAPMADARVGAVSGNTKVGNRRGLLGRWQHIEYVIGFNLDRRMFDVLQCMPTVPGAIGAFRRETLDAVGGISDDTLAEDTDLTMAICRAGWRVVYAPRARAWTEAPAKLRALWRQRYRWCYGTMQAMWKHRQAVVQRGAAGHLGRRGLPYLLLFQVLLPLLAPVVDVATLAGIMSGSAHTVLISWLVFLAVQLASASYAFVLDGERLRDLWVLPLQLFIYRQLMYLVVVESVASACYGIRLRWHKLDRTGQLEDAPPVPA